MLSQEMVVFIPVGLVVVFHVIDLVHSVSYAGKAYGHRLRESRVLRSLEVETNGLVGNRSRRQFGIIRVLGYVLSRPGRGASSRNL